MKYRIIMSVVVLAVLAAVLFLTEGGSSKPQSFQPDQGFEGAKNFKIN